MKKKSFFKRVRRLFKPKKLFKLAIIIASLALLAGSFLPLFSLFR